MECKEKDCDGQIDETREIILQTSCRSGRPANPCNKCGRLHWAINGELTFDRSGNRAFLKDGHVITKKQENSATFTT